MKRPHLSILAVLTAAMLTAAPALSAQEGGPVPSAPGVHSGGTHNGNGGPGNPGNHPGHGPGAMGGPVGRMLALGAWWRNPDMVKTVGLTPDQQKRIDDTFLQNRTKLMDLHASLDREQLLLEPMLAASSVDQGRAMAQIDKVADTRAALEKEDARMLLRIRGVLTPDQWTRLQAMHHGGPGKGGPPAPAAPPAANGPRGQAGSGTPPAPLNP